MSPPVNPPTRPCPFCPDIVMAPVAAPELMVSRVYVVPLGESLVRLGPNFLAGYACCPGCGYVAAYNLTAMGADKAGRPLTWWDRLWTRL